MSSKRLASNNKMSPAFLQTDLDKNMSPQVDEEDRLMWKTKHNKNMATVGARVLSGRGGLRHQLTLSPLRTPSSSSSFTSDIQKAKTLRRNSTTYNQPVGGLLATAGLATNSIFICFLFVKKIFICLECKSMTLSGKHFSLPFLPATLSPS